jgi:LacI family transcriptional regulator
MSIQALADSLGLSISTVSRALNGYADVSAATRERVALAAKAMNYQPHPLAHRLATGKTGAVALLYPQQQTKYQEASFAALVSGAEEELQSHKLFVLSVGIALGAQEMPELQRFVNARIVDGLILVRTQVSDARIAWLQERGVPFVTLGRTLHNAPHAWVDTDNEGAFADATRALIAHGHRRIALINANPIMTFAALREQGFRSALREGHIVEADCSVHHTDLTATSGESVTQQLLASARPPTAILCVTDAMAIGAMRAVKAAGLRVGDDVAVVGYGNSEAGIYSEPPLATMDHHIMNNGRQLARLLLRVMAGEAPDTLHTVEATQLIVRQSFGPPRIQPIA